MTSMVAAVGWLSVWWATGGAAVGPTVADRLLVALTESRRVDERLAAIRDRRLYSFWSLEAIHDEDPRVRRAVLAQAVGNAWSGALPDAPLELRDDADLSLRTAATNALTAFSLTTASADALHRALGDREAAIRAAARDALRKILPARAHPWVDEPARHAEDIRAYLALSVEGPPRWERHVTDPRPVFRHAVIANVTHALRCGCRPWHADVRPMHVRWLWTALTDSDRGIRAVALDAVATLPSSWETALPIASLRVVLPALMNDPEPERRVVAVTAVRRYCAPSTGIPLLIERCADPNRDVRDAAIAALARLDAGRPDVVRCFARALAGGGASDELYDALGAAGARAARVVPALLERVEDEHRDEYDRELALDAVARIGVRDAATLARVVRYVDHEELSDATLRAIGRLGSDEAWATAPLAALLRHRGRDWSVKVHRAALRALARLGPSAAAALPAVQSFLAGGPGLVAAKHAELAIAAIASPVPLSEVALVLREPKCTESWLSEAVVPPSRHATVSDVMSAIDHPVDDVRRWAIERLETWDGATPDQIRALAGRLLDSVAAVRDAAVHRLLRFDPPPRAALPVLCEAIRRDAAKRWSARKHAVEARLALLAMIGPAPRDMIGPLWRLFAAGFEEAGAALVAMGDSVLPALPLCWTNPTLRDPVKRVRWLARFGPAAIPRIRGGVSHPSAAVRLATLRAVAEFGVDARALAPAVAARLRDPFALVRVEAVAAIEAIGVDSAATASALRSLRDDRFRFVREAAERALATRR